MRARQCGAVAFRVLRTRQLPEPERAGSLESGGRL